MQWLKDLFYKLVGKKIGIESIDSASRAKISFIIYILLSGIEEGSKIWGHPIVIPQSIKDMIAGLGFWYTRDAIKS